MLRSFERLGAASRMASAQREPAASRVVRRSRWRAAVATLYLVISLGWAPAGRAQSGFRKDATEAPVVETSNKTLSFTTEQKLRFCVQSTFTPLLSRDLSLAPLPAARETLISRKVSGGEMPDFSRLVGASAARVCLQRLVSRA